MPQYGKTQDPRHPTVEQRVLFELARSRALREGSHTVTEDNAKPQAKAPEMVDNPNYQGISGIFNAISDGLSGNYQPKVKK